ncbi:flavin reductase family protein [Zavarzinia compransoris]|uniref:Flavin reductase n=1 Tax=Zavarzinia compransoris TaxID=1264899 RepID=A0A317DXE3_9PROT|nr:flavin reductase family protein [Zavarzinia compransoris]PWR19181.1 flavin reductase [Zavarzinia compransoris]TDP49197.1 flavin reductase (DIM6/NTAB) family NADH-FMN oxidoreductase RutF [Zavarzinia compransoris]
MADPIPSVAPELITAFKGAMRRLAATVTVISTGDGSERHGMTATAVTSVTTDPPALLICVNKTASLHPVLATGTRFCVNLLKDSHAEVAGAFGGRLQGPERFGTGDWASNAHGVPYLTDAQANLFCRVDALMLYGTHTIFVGLVEDVRLFGDISPLIYQDGRYIKAS